jgi:hypothetical protein
MSTPYLPPLDQLLALGEPEFGYRAQWPDYLGMGFTVEHVPELIRMVADEELDTGDDKELESGDAPEQWAYIHAWRVLGLLRAEAAIGVLVEFLGVDDGWANEELPVVLGMIGPASLEPLRTALARWSLVPSPWVAGAAGNGLVEIAQRFPDARDAAAAALTRQLRWWARHNPILNTMLVHDLVELHAVEAAPVMEEVFAAGAVDTRWDDDDWEDVQVALGLLPERVTPKPPYVPPAWPRYTPLLRVLAAKPAAASKRRKKAAKAARQRKRKRR